MRGPFDDVIAAQQQPELVEEGVPEEEAAEHPLLPGGKPLARLLQLLEAEGMTETAAEAVEVAVPAEDRAEFDARMAQFTADPSGEVLHGAAKRRPRRRGGRTRAAGGAAAAPAETDELSEQTKDVAQTYMEVSDHLGPPTPTGPQWRSLGPWTIPNGQTYGSNRVNVSGRISSIAVDPSNPAHVLVGAAHGGVWESRDRGASWAPRSDYAATLTVGALAFDPSNPSIVYCGTGEGNWWSWLGAGVLRSTNGGTTWAQHCTAPFVGVGFYALIVDRADGNHLLAGTRNGLYVSTNGGTGWTRRRTPRTWSVAMAPAGGARAEILAGCSDGVFRSTDGGTNWAAVTLPGNPGTFDRLEVAIAPSNPAVAYAWGARGSTAYLWRRAGGTWTSVAAPPGVSVGQAWYDWFVAVAPDRDTQLYCGAIEVHRGDLAGGTWTWLNLSNKGASGTSIHPDQHNIAFEPGQPNTIYVANDGGLFRSPDRGTNWVHCNNGLIISEFEYIAQDHGSARWIIGGTQDNGTNRWTGSATWEHVADGDGGDCGVNRTDPNTAFHTYYGMSPERSTSRGNWGSWAWLPPPVPSGEGSLFYPPFETSATSGDTLAIGGDRVYLSRNNATAWVARAFPSAARSSAMYIPNADNVYVGTTDGRVLRTQWTGTTWTALTALTTPRTNAVVSDLHVSPTNLSRMWATYSTIGGGRVFQSTDGGSTWTDRSAGLPNLPINAVEVHPSNTNRVWVGADLGVYQSLDGGASWADFANALPHVFVGDLIYHPHARVLRAGTRNRGVWEIPVDGWMTQPVCGVQWTGSLAASEERRWFTFNWPATWHVVWTAMPTSPRPGAPQLTATVRVERASAEFATYWISVRNLTAQPLTFEGRYCILSRY